MTQRFVLCLQLVPRLNSEQVELGYLEACGIFVVTMITTVTIIITAVFRSGRLISQEFRPSLVYWVLDTALEKRRVELGQDWRRGGRLCEVSVPPPRGLFYTQGCYSVALLLKCSPIVSWKVCKGISCWENKLLLRAPANATRGNSPGLLYRGWRKKWSTEHTLAMCG